MRWLARQIEKANGSTSLVLLYDLAGRRIGAVSTAGADVDHHVYAAPNVRGRLVAAYSDGTTYYYHSNQLGAAPMTLQERGGPCCQNRTDRVVTATGLVQETCTSLPFGDNQSCTGTVPARFAGYYTDDEFGLDHAPARYYSPALGRFMTPDPFGTPPAGGTCSAGGVPSDAMTGPLSRPESLNRYAYVTDNPTTYSDPSGNFIRAADCFLDAGLLPECQCDPVFGCPPELLVLILALPPFIHGAVVSNLICHSTTEKPVVAHCPYIFEGEGGSGVTLGIHDLSKVDLIKACGPIALNSCPRYVHVTVTDTFVFGIGISQKVAIKGCAN